MHNRCVIVGGAKIENYRRIKDFICKDDFVIYCDCGLKHMEQLGIQPNLIIGDFDSWNNPKLEIETIVLPTAKDDTDTVFAMKEGLKRGYKEFIIIGAVGGRMDHTLCNVYMLNSLYEEGVDGIIIDDYSTMKMIGNKAVFVEDSCKYFSLINIDGSAHDISISGAKFPLEHGEVSCTYQYATSNEVLPGQKACITIGQGRMLLIIVECE